MNPTHNWIDRVELVHLGFGLYELRIGSRVMGAYSKYADAWDELRRIVNDFDARNGGAA